MTDLGRMLTCEEAAHRLGVRVSTVRRMIWEKRIDTVRPTKRSVRIPEASIDALLQGNFTPAIVPDQR